MADEPEIIYEPLQLPSGVLARPTLGSMLDALLRGSRVFVRNKNDLSAFQKAFRRLGIDGKRIAVAQVDVTKWRVLVVDANDRTQRNLPGENGFEKRRGRYAKLAAEIQQDRVCAVANAKAALALLQAWRRYIPAQKRDGLSGVVRPTETGWVARLEPRRKRDRRRFLHRADRARPPADRG